MSPRLFKFQKCFTQLLEYICIPNGPRRQHRALGAGMMFYQNMLFLARLNNLPADDISFGCCLHIITIVCRFDLNSYLSLHNDNMDEGKLSPFNFEPSAPAEEGLDVPFQFSNLPQAGWRDVLIKHFPQPASTQGKCLLGRWLVPLEPKIACLAVKPSVSARSHLTTPMIIMRRH